MGELSCNVDAAGISALPYGDILSKLQSKVRAIYGEDIYIDADSQDGQFLAILARAIDEDNQSTIDSFNSFSPAKAQGAGLSSNVKINGIKRHAATTGQVVLRIGGTVGSVITNGIAGDNLELGTQWLLPATVTIPASAEIEVTAISATAGEIKAAPGSITRILGGSVTPSTGWASVTNDAAATPGTDAQTDAELRRQQAESTSQGETVLEALKREVANLPGVVRSKIYQNDKHSVDAYGIPPHSIAAVVDGGDAQEIGEALADKKSPGCGTYGNIQLEVFDRYGVPNTVFYSQLTRTDIFFAVTLEALSGYVSTTGQLVLQAIAQFINDLDIGETVYYHRLYSPANLMGTSAMTVSGLSQAALDRMSDTYNVTDILIGLSDLTLSRSNIAMAFLAAAQSSVDNGELTVPAL